MDRLEQKKLDLLEREIVIKERELELKLTKESKSHWHSPLVVAIGAAALGAFANIAVSLYNANETLRNLNVAAEHQRILEMIKIGKPDQVRENLVFLIESGLVQSEDVIAGIATYYDNATIGTGPGSNITESSIAESVEPPSFIWPVEGEIARPFAGEGNTGLDIATEPSSPVYAAATGTVAALTSDKDEVLILVLRHSGSYLSVYVNVENILVRKGDVVEQGQPIATTPKSPRNFLHFEVRDGFDPVDPMLFLSE